MLVVLLESVMLSVLGGLAGVVLAHLAIGAASDVIVGQTGVTVSMFHFDLVELIVIPALIVLASLVGYLPALAAYRTDVAKVLSAAR
jgi:putative ABC transport system permease protein